MSVHVCWKVRIDHQHEDLPKSSFTLTAIRTDFGGCMFLHKSTPTSSMYFCRIWSYSRAASSSGWLSRSCNCSQIVARVYHGAEMTIRGTCAKQRKESPMRVQTKHSIGMRKKEGRLLTFYREPGGYCCRAQVPAQLEHVLETMLEVRQTSAFVML